MKMDLKQLARSDGRFEPAAFKFVHEGLGYTINQFSDTPQVQPRHVSGDELCNGLRDKALKQWGRLAKMVLNNWGVKTTHDFGEIVYLMIENKWMSANPNDTIDDFNDVYDFETAFESQFEDLL